MIYSRPKEATALLLYWQPSPSGRFSGHRLGEEAFLFSSRRGRNAVHAMRALLTHSVHHVEG